MALPALVVGWGKERLILQDRAKCLLSCLYFFGIAIMVVRADAIFWQPLLSCPGAWGSLLPVGSRDLAPPCHSPTSPAHNVDTFTDATETAFFAMRQKSIRAWNALVKQEYDVALCDMQSCRTIADGLFSKEQ